MAKPVLLAVDDDRHVLGAIERDLRKHYAGEYRIMTALSGNDSLQTLQGLQRRGTAVALLLVDERMPGMTGLEFLCEARKLYPDAARVLITAYADTAAAIKAINEVALHHYLMKPWDPPEQRLYPVLDDQLAAWAERARPTFDGIRVVGSRWSPQSYAAREFLTRNQVPYQWVEMDLEPVTREPSLAAVAQHGSGTTASVFASDERVREPATPSSSDALVLDLVRSIAGESPRLPVVLFPDGSSLIAPTNAELAAKLGLGTAVTRPFYDVVIVGGGPAGLANAVYAASEGLKTLLIEEHAPGGQAGGSSMIENYLGFPGGLTGADLAQRAAAQAKRFGAELLVGQPVAELRREDPYRIVRLASGHEVSCHALVIATGMAVRELQVPGVSPLVGCGIYYGAAMSEAALYRGQDVAIVGGANSAGQGALFFSRYARNVTILVRAPGLSPAMSRYLVDRIETTANIQVLSRVEVAEACGQGRLQKVVLKDVEGGATRPLDVAAMFIYIGVSPRTEQFAGVLELDAKGFIVTGPDLPRGSRAWPLERDPLMFETSVPGVFAAGDVRSGANRRIAAAVGEGSAAIYSVHRYLQTV